MTNKQTFEVITDTTICYSGRNYSKGDILEFTQAEAAKYISAGFIKSVNAELAKDSNDLDLTVEFQELNLQVEILQKQLDEREQELASVKSSLTDANAVIEQQRQTLLTQQNELEALKPNSVATDETAAKEAEISKTAKSKGNE